MAAKVTKSLLRIRAHRQNLSCAARRFLPQSILSRKKMRATKTHNHSGRTPSRSGLAYGKEPSLLKPHARDWLYLRQLRESPLGRIVYLTMFWLLFVFACLYPQSAHASPPGNFTLSNQTPVCDHNPPEGPAVTLNWTASSGATSYQVYRNGSAIGPATAGLTFYNSLGLVAGQSYTYFV